MDETGLDTIGSSASRRTSRPHPLGCHRDEQLAVRLLKQHERESSRRFGFCLRYRTRPIDRAPSYGIPTVKLQFPSHEVGAHRRLRIIPFCVFPNRFVR